MNYKDIIFAKIQSVIDKYKLELESYNNILYIIINGSFTLNFISKPQDIDIVIIRDDTGSNAQMRDFMMRIYHELQYETDYPESVNISISLKSFKRVIKWVKGTNSPECAYNIIYYKYLYLNSNRMPELRTTYNIYAVIEDKKLFIEFLKIFLDFIKSDIMIAKINDKPKNLYHVLTNLYFIENKGEKFTEEQIKNINIAHDHLEDYNQLYNYATDKISKLDINNIDSDLLYDKITDLKNNLSKNC